MNAKNYAQELYDFWTRTKEGPGKALSIAKRNFENSSPKNWGDLPSGSTFGYKGFGSEKWNLDLRALKNTHEFWTHVYYILKKKV